MNNNLHVSSSESESTAEQLPTFEKNLFRNLLQVSPKSATQQPGTSSTCIGTFTRINKITECNIPAYSLALSDMLIKSI